MKTHRLYNQRDLPSEPDKESSSIPPTQYAPPPYSSYSSQLPPPNPYPYPMYPPQLPPKKSDDFFNKKVMVPVWLICLIVPLTLCGLIASYSIGSYNTSLGNQNNLTSNDNNQSNSSANTSQDTSTPADTPTLIPTPVGPAKVGDTITVNGVDCTLISVLIIQGDEFSQPKAGNEFIVVHVKLVNNSGTDANYNEFDFHARTSSGNVTDPEASPSTYTANDELNYGTLSQGGNVEGDIILETPKGDHGAELSWEPAFDSNSTDNLWNLGL